MKGIEFQAAKMANELINQIEAGEIAVDQLKERFSKIKSPEAGVEKLSPVEHFTVKSGAMRVTDPCYQMDTWCAGTLENVKDGRWSAFVSTQFSEQDIEWSKDWRKQYMDELVFEKLSREKVLEVFGAEDRSGNPRTEEDIERLARFYGARRLEGSIRRLIESELYNDGNQIGRVWHLHVHHQDHPILEMDDSWQRSEIHVGVDSGQAGFFDLSWFAEYSPAGVSQERGGEWDKTYSQLCDKTLETAFGFGCVDHGAVSSSGYGDGGYDLFYKTDDQGEVIAARIVYICAGEDEDEGEEE